MEVPGGRALTKCRYLKGMPQGVKGELCPTCKGKGGTHKGSCIHHGLRHSGIFCERFWKLHLELQNSGLQS